MKMIKQLVMYAVDVVIFWQMSSSILHQAQLLKQMVEQAKQQSLAEKEFALEQQKLQLEKEKQEVC